MTEAWAQAGTGECEAESELDSSDMGGLGAYWTSYEYDETGNRTSVTEHATSGAATNAAYAYAKAHLVESVTTASTVNTYKWDPSGNMTERVINGQKETLAWNAQGKLATIASAKGTTKMVYDGENNRLARIDADGTQNLFVAGHEIVVDPQGVVHATRTYAHNGEMIATRSTDTGLTWIGTTHQGTAAWAISAATLALTYRRQDPFGNDRGDAVNWSATQQGFHTGTEDPTGLVSMGARFYDPTTGRFISRDPIMAFTDSQQINGYAYAHNNPINFSDPSGLWDCNAECQMAYNNSRANCNCYMPEDIREGTGADLPGDPGYGDGDPVTTIYEQDEITTTVTELDDGVLIIDGYVIPNGSGISNEEFIAAYLEAALLIGGPGDYENNLFYASVVAETACTEILGARNMRCDHDFVNLLRDDQIAIDNGVLLPSYTGIDLYTLMDLDDNGDGWSDEEYAEWGEMAGGSGMERKLLQQQLAAAGIYHEPDFALPVTPVGAAFSCAAGATGVGAILGAGDAGYGKATGKLSWGGAARAAMKGSLYGCVGGTAYYLGFWHSS
jgi:RHS repeat-associated protein